MPTIVYLDDDRIQHLLMKKQLQLHLPGSKLQVFAQPENLIEWLQENEAQLILSDLNLEGGAIWDWVDQITAKSSAFLVLVTAHISPDDLRKKEAFSQVRMILEKPLSESNWEVISAMIS